jgi:hypothetical protein
MHSCGPRLELLSSSSKTFPESTAIFAAGGSCRSNTIVCGWRHHDSDGRELQASKPGNLSLSRKPVFLAWRIVPGPVAPDAPPPYS